MLREPGQTQILNSHIDLTRRQAFVFASAGAVSVVSGLWSTLKPVPSTVQASLDQADDALTGHFDATGNRHDAKDIDSAPHGFITADKVQGALDELVDKLSSGDAGTPGASIIGADAITGTPKALSQGSVDGQLSAILGWLNEHLQAATGAHQASAVSAAAHGVITTLNVQAQLQQIVSLLASQADTEGTALVGNHEIGGTPHALADGTIRQHLAQLLDWLNTHIGSGDHDSRYYNVGAQVPSADTVDGLHAADFALVGHDHDYRYMRQTYVGNKLLAANELQHYTTLSDPPDLVTTVYAYDDGSGSPEATSYLNGQYSADIRVWVTKIDMGGGDKDYRISVRNMSTESLHVKVTAYTRD